MVISRTSSLTLLRRLIGPSSTRASRSIIGRSSSRSRTWQDLHRRAVSSYLLAGAVGGSVVVVGGYAWYHFSSVKPTVETVKRIQTSIKTAGTISGLLLENAREKTRLLVERLGSEVKRVKSEVISQSPISRTVKEKAAWLRRSIRGDSTPRTPQTDEEDSKRK